MKSHEKDKLIEELANSLKKKIGEQLKIEETNQKLKIKLSEF